MKNKILINLLILLTLTLSFQTWAAPDTTQVKCQETLQIILRGHLGTVTPAFVEEKNDFLKQLAGLNYNEVIPWEPNKKDKALRRLIRKHGVTSLLSKNIPAFDHTQKVGPARVHINELHFSQYAASNHTGEYTVVGNAIAFKSGQLDPTKFPRIQVWRDVTGKIWTLDHRRLVSMVLAGMDREIDVEFVSFDFFKDDRFKFTNMGDGNSIVLSLTKEDKTSKAPIAIVITKPKAKGVFKKVENSTLERALQSERDGPSRKWEDARGENYLLSLEKYSATLSEEYKLAAEGNEGEVHSLFNRIAEVKSRAKEADSVLAKLIKKDKKLFEAKKSIKDLDEARGLIGDGIGIRAFLNSNNDGLVDSRAVDVFVDRLATKIEQGSIQVTEILNYRATNNETQAYLTDQHIQKLINADLIASQRAKKLGKPHTMMIAKNGPGAYKEMGYTSFHFNFGATEDIIGEVQVRGRLIHQVTETMHLFYDLKTGKPLRPEILEKPILAAAVKAFLELSEKDKSSYYNYLQKAVIQARKSELGVETSKVLLPSNFPKELDIEKLKLEL